MRRLASSFVLLFFLASPLAGQDQPRPPEPPHPPPTPTGPHPQPPGHEQPDSAERRKELRRRIQALRMARLTQVLDLDDATAAKLFPLLNKHDEKVAALSEERGAALGKLDAAIRGKDDAALPALLDRVAEIERAVHEDDDATHRKIREALSAAQMAKLLLFNEHFHEEVRALLEDARRDGGDPHGAEAIAARINVLVDEVNRLIHGGHAEPQALAPRFVEFDRLVEAFKKMAPEPAQKEALPRWTQWAEQTREARLAVAGHMMVAEGSEIVRAMAQALEQGHPEAVAPLNERLARLAEQMKKDGNDDVKRAADDLLAHGKEALAHAQGGGGAARGGARALVAAADAKAKKGDFQGAIADLTDAISQDPHDAEIYFRRAAAREGAGDAHGAAADYERCLQLSPAGERAKDAKAAAERLRGPH